VQDVWHQFGCKTLYDYAVNAYLKSDVMILCDIFENHRKTIHDAFGVDPAYYMTTPGVTWACALRFSGASITPITEGNEDKYDFVMSAKRGGMVNAIQRKTLKGNGFIAYIDANNLYGSSMRFKMPCGAMDWLPRPMTIDELLELDEDGDYGYLCEVDIECPPEIHDYVNDMPMFPEFKEGKPSEYIKNLYPNRGINKKLVSDLNPKMGYVTCLQMIRFAHSIGYKFTKVHRILRFEQRDWLKGYIDALTAMRDLAGKRGDKAGRNTFKLMANAVYGKTTEDPTKYADITALPNEVASTRYWSRTKKCHVDMSFEEAQFKLDRQHHRAIKKDIVTTRNYGEFTAYKAKRHIVKNDKPSLVGVMVLELSKLHMFKSFYNVIKPKNPDIKLLYMDTDSFFLWNPTPIDYAEIAGTGIGMFKDEMPDETITKVIALAPKSYAVEVENTKVSIAMKGIPKKAVDSDGNGIGINAFEGAFQHIEQPKVSSYSLRSKDHTVRCIKTTKKSVSGYDDKRHVLEDGVHTLAHGHYRINDRR
jgi:hypothetical protein